jgi:hypothetical protein
MIDTVSQLERLVDCIKKEASITDCPHVLEAAVGAAATCLNQGLLISSLGRNQAHVQARLYARKTA